MLSFYLGGQWITFVLYAEMIYCRLVYLFGCDLIDKNIVFVILLLCLINILMLILNSCRLTLNGIIWRNSFVLNYKRCFADFIFCNTLALQCAKNVIDAHLVQILLIADHRLEQQFKIIISKCKSLNYSFFVLIFYS